MRRVRTWILCSALALAGGAHAQPGWFFGQGGTAAGDEGEREPTSLATTVTEPTRPFVIGRDNLAFANLSGAITIEGMSGNCYTMATVARLFHEAASFRPQERVSPTLRESEVARTLRSGAYPSPRFPVRGFGSLYEMSTGPAGVDDEDWMEGWARHEAGLRATPPAGEVPVNQEALVGLYQMISTIHYMHYVQFQARHLVGSAVRRATEGGRAAPRVMADTVRRVKHDLANGRLPLICIFNPRPSVFYGHVVLGHRLVEHPGETYTDIYVYDSNIQYAGSRWLTAANDEVFLRVHDDARLEIFREGADGRTSALSIYDGDTWFEDAGSTVLVVMDDLEDDAGLRRVLARKLASMRENAGYLLATGDALRRLTTRSPAQSGLFEDVRAFVHDLSKVGGGPELPADATVGQLNAYLAANTRQAVRTAFPLALPDGVRVEGLSLRFDPARPGTARLVSTLRISSSASIEALLDTVRASALVGDEALADVVAAATRAFEGQSISLKTDVELAKGRSSGGLGEYGPIPVLKGSHIVVGNLRPGPMVAGDDHRIEIAEVVVQRFVRDLLRRADLIGERFTYAYEIPVLGRRRAYLEIDDVVVDTRDPFFGVGAGRIGIRVKYHGFAGVVSRSRGVNLSSEYTTLWLRLVPGQGRNRVDVYGDIDGDHRISAGVPFGIGTDTVIQAVMAEVFDRFDETLDDFLEEQLAPYVELVGHGPRLRDLRVNTRGVEVDIRRFTVGVEESLARVLGFSADQVPVALTGLDVTDDRVVVRLRNE